MSHQHHEPDPLLAALAQLPLPDCGAERRERIRALAHAALAPRPSPWRAWGRAAARAYCQLLEPAWVATVGVVFLSWALARVAQLLG